MDQLQAWDIMTVGVVKVRPEDSLEEATHIMVEHGISGLPVVDDEDKLVGILTEGDLLRRKELGTGKRRWRWIEMFTDEAELAREYVHERGRKVADVMSHNVISVPAGASLEEIVELMERHGFKRLPVVKQGRVVGIISRANIVRSLSRRLSRPPYSLKTDLAMRENIISELHKTHWAPFGTIQIDVHDGIVALDGTVTNQSIREALRVAAENAPGVKKVNDNLCVVALPAGYV